MPPAKVDLAIYQGDDFELALTFTAAGAPMNLTGHTFAAQIRTSPADTGPPPEAEMVCTITDAAAGKLHLSIPHAVTEDMPTATPHVWDLQSIDPAGKTKTYLAGAVTVTAEVTRP